MFKQIVFASYTFLYTLKYTEGEEARVKRSRFMSPSPLLSSLRRFARSPIGSHRFAPLLVELLLPSPLLVGKAYEILLSPISSFSWTPLQQGKTQHSFSITTEPIDWFLILNSVTYRESDLLLNRYYLTWLILFILSLSKRKTPYSFFHCSVSFIFHFLLSFFFLSFLSWFYLPTHKR